MSASLHLPYTSAAATAALGGSVHILTPKQIKEQQQQQQQQEHKQQHYYQHDPEQRGIHVVMEEEKQEPIYSPPLNPALGISIMSPAAAAAYSSAPPVSHPSHPDLQLPIIGASNGGGNTNTSTAPAAAATSPHQAAAAANSSPLRHHKTPQLILTPGPVSPTSVPLTYMECMLLLTKGETFCKYAASPVLGSIFGASVVKRYVFYEKERGSLGCIYWCKPGLRIKDPARCIPLHSITGLYEQAETEAFGKHLTPEEKTRCFSIVCGEITEKNAKGEKKVVRPGRTLDLQADSVEIRDTWMHCIHQILIHSGFDVHEKEDKAAQEKLSSKHANHSNHGHTSKEKKTPTSASLEAINAAAQLNKAQQLNVATSTSTPTASALSGKKSSNGVIQNPSAEQPSSTTSAGSSSEGSSFNMEGPTIHVENSTLSPIPIVSPDPLNSMNRAPAGGEENAGNISTTNAAAANNLLLSPPPTNFTPVNSPAAGMELSPAAAATVAAGSGTATDAAVIELDVPPAEGEKTAATSPEPAAAGTAESGDLMKLELNVAPPPESRQVSPQAQPQTVRHSETVASTTTTSPRNGKPQQQQQQQPDGSSVVFQEDPLLQAKLIRSLSPSSANELPLPHDPNREIRATLTVPLSAENNPNANVLSPSTHPTLTPTCSPVPSA